jgi:myo-inositol catabolism protein IolC
MPRGYDRPFYIQPFEQRGFLQKNMFGWKGTLSEAQTAEIAAARRVIYDGFKAAIAGGVPKEKAGILVDEQFGAAILRDAKAEGFTTCAPAEKSGQDEFDFEPLVDWRAQKITRDQAVEQMARRYRGFVDVFENRH